jgi:hypothetical protein
MPKISISLSDMQLISDAVNRCYTADVDDFKFKLELAQFRKAVLDHTGQGSPLSETRQEAFKKYGLLSENGENYTMPTDVESRNKLIKAIEDALSVKVNVPFPALDAERMDKLNLPLNASEISVLISCGVIQEIE